MPKMIKSRRRPFEDTSSGSLQDLSFLLIVFFIVIAGFNVNKGFVLNLPSKEKPKVVQQNDLMKASLNADGTLILNGENSNLEELCAALQEKQKEWPNMTFLLSINPETPYQNVVDVIYEIRNLNIENFCFKMEGGV